MILLLDQTHYNDISIKTGNSASKYSEGNLGNQNDSVILAKILLCRSYVLNNDYKKVEYFFTLEGHFLAHQPHTWWGLNFCFKIKKELISSFGLHVKAFAQHIYTNVVVWLMNFYDVHIRVILHSSSDNSELLYIESQ